MEGLLYFTADGRLMLRDDYHNHPESKRVLERLLEVRSPEGKVLFRNELLGNRSLGDTLAPARRRRRVFGAAVHPGRWLRVQLVSRRHAVEGRPTIIRVAYSEAPLWNQFRADLIALILPLAAGARGGGHWRLRSRVAIAAADSAAGAQSGGDQERPAARAPAGECIRWRTGRSGSRVQCHARAAGTVVRAASALHIGCFPRAENPACSHAKRRRSGAAEELHSRKAIVT